MYVLVFIYNFSKINLFLFFCCFHHGKYCICSFYSFLFRFSSFVYIIVSVFLRFRFGCAMLFLLLASYGWRKINFLKPPLVKFYNMRRFFFILQNSGFLFWFYWWGYSLEASALIFWICSLSWLHFRREFPPLLFVYITSFSIWLASLHIVQRHFYLKLQPGLIALSLRGSICRNDYFYLHLIQGHCSLRFRPGFGFLLVPRISLQNSGLSFLLAGVGHGLYSEWIKFNPLE